MFDPTLSEVHQNDRFVVILTATPDRLGSGQYVIADPLPAGFEIENPDLSASNGVGDLNWLALNYPNHVEYLEISPPERIVLRHGSRQDDPDAFISTVTFEERAEGCQAVSYYTSPSPRDRG